MPRKRLKNVATLHRETGYEPLVYLYRRCADLIEQGEHEHAERISMKLVGYVRHPKGAEPVKEVKDAITEGRLVVVSSPTE